MIHASGLRKSFGRRAVLNGLELTVGGGAVTLLVGPNAAGKTTALRILAGLSEPDAGTVVVAGLDLHRDRRRALAALSFLPQSPRFHPRLTTRQVALFHGRCRGCLVPEIDQALTAWGLPDHRDTPTGQLSGGLRQRLALAIFSLARGPVRILDEPGLSLDPEWRGRLQRFLAEEAKRGRAVLVATHLLGEWEGRADRCLLLSEGGIRGELPTSRLRESYPHWPTLLPPTASASSHCA